jgi:hypothetical protein
VGSPLTARSKPAAAANWLLYARAAWLSRMFRICKCDRVVHAWRSRAGRNRAAASGGITPDFESLVAGASDGCSDASTPRILNK